VVEIFALQPLLALDTLLSGDCVEILAQLPEASVDVVFGDPPYNLQLKQVLRRPNQTKVAAVDDGWDKFASLTDYDRFTRAWLTACRRVLKDTGTIWVIGMYHNIFRVGAILQDLDFWILNDVIWTKTNPMPQFKGMRFANAHETLIWAQKKRGAKYTFNYRALKSLNDDLQMRSDWTFPLVNGRQRLRSNGAKAHSTQKPEALLYRILLASSKPGDVVLDPFFGTGTTGAVAKRLGRHWIGIERDKTYLKVARERIVSVEPAPQAALEFAEPRRQKRLPFGALLEVGLLQPGQTLWFARDQSTTAMVLANGELRCGQLTGSIHAVARSLLEGGPANGWDLWMFADDAGRRRPIDELRQQLRAAEQAESNPPPA
jgi:site-specific DNA-methyltransferase (adenine-specific)